MQPEEKGVARVAGDRCISYGVNLSGCRNRY